MIISQVLDWGDAGAYVGVALLAMVKFSIGLAAGLLKGFNFTEHMLSGCLGGLIGAWIFTFFGEAISKWLRKTLNLTVNTDPNKKDKYRWIWDRYGLAGVSALTPILSPQLSIAIALSFGEKPRRILLYISISVIFWSIMFFLLKESVVDIMAKR